jgi:hypothetical protein
MLKHCFGGLGCGSRGRVPTYLPIRMIITIIRMIMTSEAQDSNPRTPSQNHPNNSKNILWYRQPLSYG